MKKVILFLAFAFPYMLFAQIGIKAGVNFANVSNAASINASSQSGFHAGFFLSPGTKGIIGFRSEILYSRQGYNYKTSTNTGNVNLNYIMLPNFMAINITKFVQLQFGGQIGFLLNASVDSTSNSTTTNPYEDAMSYFNRIDFCYGGGVEIHPFKGLLIGARVNISLTNLFTDIGTTPPGDLPSFIPDIDVKNNLFQIFAGWTFGGSSGKKDKKEKEQ